MSHITTVRSTKILNRLKRGRRATPGSMKFVRSEDPDPDGIVMVTVDTGDGEICYQTTLTALTSALDQIH